MTPLLNPATSKIIKELEPISASGIGSYQIFQDFIDITCATLERMPAHVRAALSKEPFTDTSETADLFKRMREKYKDKHWERMERAFCLLLETCDDYQDTLGQVFEAFGSPNSKAGQFFTPWEVSQLMARMIMGDIERQVYDRIKDAIEGNILAESMLFASQIIENSDDAAEFFYDRLLPIVLPDVKPVTICDPACGSAGMLLAAASCCPRWVLDYNLVRFYGMDIDQRCVTMARINMMLYGLNGFGIKCALALTPGEMESVPQPWREKYQEAQAADQAGDITRVDAIRQEVGNWKQSSLF